MGYYLRTQAAKQLLEEVGLLVEENDSSLVIRRTPNGYPSRITIVSGMVFKKSVDIILRKVKGK